MKRFGLEVFEKFPLLLILITFSQHTQFIKVERAGYEEIELGKERRTESLEEIQYLVSKRVLMNYLKCA